LPALNFFQSRNVLSNGILPFHLRLLPDVHFDLNIIAHVFIDMSFYACPCCVIISAQTQHPPKSLSV
jgi:hypothetical protein